MTEGKVQAMRAAGFVVAALLAVLAQRLAPHGRVRGSWRVNGGLWLVDTAVVGAVCGACGFTAAAWAARNGFGVLNQAAASLWTAVPVTVVVLDLVSYGWHWANHRVPFLWRLHQVHHSDPSFTVSTGVRFHPGELLLSLPVRLAAVVLIGAPVAAVTSACRAGPRAGSHGAASRPHFIAATTRRPVLSVIRTSARYSRSGIACSGRSHRMTPQ